MTEHLTEDQICRAIAGQATIDEQRHLHVCMSCHVEVDRSRSTLMAFRQAVSVRAERQARQTMPSWEPRAASGGRRAWTFAFAGIGAVAAVAVSQIGVQPPPVSAPRSAAASALDGDFFPLDYSTVPVTDGHILRLEVPRSSVEAFGVDPVELVSPRPDAVLADVLVGEDGLARAVRFVRRVRDDSVDKENMR